VANRISEKFKELGKEGRKALIAYLTCGYPDMEATYKLVLEAEEAGVDLIELGIPYSDPLADGPIIQAASEKALEKGTNIDMIFEMARRLREKTQLPLVIMTYYNAVFRYGSEKFMKGCKESGIDGLIVPDLPYEEKGAISGIAKSSGIDLIPLVAPTSEDRISKLVSDASGFVYCVSSKGVTGKRSSFAEGLEDFMKSVRRHTDLPLAIGFGISDGDAARSVKDMCDGVIVGSAIIERIGQGASKGDISGEVRPFIESLRSALD